jgi:pSer/pThr/pTyr-binding forkhead associated (FHA) protein
MILEWTIGGRQHSRWLSPGTTAILGRSPDCAIVIAHPTVSRRHAEVFGQGTGLQIRNLSQTNPIIIAHHGQVVRLESGHLAALSGGAQIRLGEVEIRVKEPAALRVRCPGPCGKVVSVPASGFCPNCGTALATADTFIG